MNSTELMLMDQIEEEVWEIKSNNSSCMISEVKYVINH